MVDIIKSPDGKHVMSENSDLPEHLKSKWIPIEEWEEEVSKIRHCPICGRFTLTFSMFDEADGDAECSACDDEYFSIKSIDPLIVVRERGQLRKYWFPMKMPSTLSKKGLEFELREFEDENIDNITEAIWIAVCQLKNEIQRLYEQEFDATDYFDFDFEEIDEEKEEYNLDD